MSRYQRYEQIDSKIPIKIKDRRENFFIKNNSEKRDRNYKETQDRN